jgi:hypothetical protein
VTARLWRRHRARRGERIFVPPHYRPLFTGEVFPPPPPTPAMLREAAAVLKELAFSPETENPMLAAWERQNSDVAEWLLEIAKRLPEPYRYREFFAPPDDDGGPPPSSGYIRALHVRAGLCTATSPRLDEHQIPYTCTREAKHFGVHRAEGPDGEVYDTWPAR